MISLGNPPSPIQVKCLSLAALLVFIWIFFSGSAPKQYSLGLSSTIKGFGGATTKTGLLPLSEAKEYCAARRWKPYPYRQAPRKIYDLVLINTELEWLEIRMGQMNDQVDFFVIVEAAITFTDQEKPLHVRENWERFAKYHHKMILHTLETDGVDFPDTWARERFSRNAMYDQVIPRLEGAQEAFQGDVILVSDVDEIPRPDVLKALRNCDFPKEVTLHTNMHYYSFQWLKRNSWPHPQATFYALESTVRPDDLRKSNGEHLFNAGWHCSYCFDTVAEMVTKIKSFSHTEMNKEEFTDVRKIVGRVRAGKDMFDRGREVFDRIEDNPDIPAFLLKNQKKYGYMLDRDSPTANFKDVTPEDVAEDKEESDEDT